LASGARLTHCMQTACQPASQSNAGRAHQLGLHLHWRAPSLIQAHLPRAAAKHAARSYRSPLPAAGVPDQYCVTATAHTGRAAQGVRTSRQATPKPQRALPRRRAQVPHLPHQLPPAARLHDAGAGDGAAGQRAPAPRHAGHAGPRHRGRGRVQGAAARLPGAWNACGRAARAPATRLCPPAGAGRRSCRRRPVHACSCQEARPTAPGALGPPATRAGLRRSMAAALPYQARVWHAQLKQASQS